MFEKKRKNQVFAFFLHKKKVLSPKWYRICCKLWFCRCRSSFIRKHWLSAELWPIKKMKTDVIKKRKSALFLKLCIFPVMLRVNIVKQVRIHAHAKIEPERYNFGRVRSLQKCVKRAKIKFFRNNSKRTPYQDLYQEQKIRPTLYYTYMPNFNEKYW